MPLTSWQSPVPRHEVDVDGKVTWLELFFDLVYVAALILLGGALAYDLTWGGAVRFAVLFVVLWWTWTGTTFYANRVAVDDLAHRALVVAQMFGVTNLAIQAPEAFGDRATAFALSYVSVRLLLIAMYVRARRIMFNLRPLADLYLRSFAAGAALWTISAFVPSSTLRYTLWAAALVIELSAPVLPKARAVFARAPVHQAHMRERYAVFTIIVLGESFVKSTGSLADRGISVEAGVYGLLAFLIGVALWWTYFDDIADARIHSGRRAGLLGVVWVYSHLPLTGALTAYGVAAERMVVLENLTDPLPMTTAVLLAGSLSVALLATTALDLVTENRHFAIRERHRVGPRLSAVVLVWVAVVTTRQASAVVTTGLVAIIMASQIVLEVAVAATADRRVRKRVALDLDRNAADGCEDLVNLKNVVPEAEECTACEEIGATWVHLRVCMQCGNVGCCDDSEHRHARKHWHDEDHPVIRSMERSEDWAFCFRHDATIHSWN